MSEGKLPLTEYKRARFLYYYDNGDSESTAWAICAVCGRVWRDFDVAERCCAPRTCSRCEAAIPMAEKGYTACAPCRELSRQEKLQARWDKAEKLDGWAWEGPIATDDYEGPYDGFWRDLDELQEWLFDNELELSDVRCYATKKLAQRLDAVRIVEDAMSCAYEGAFDDLPNGALEELQKFLDVWREENIPTTWIEDDTKALVFE